MRFFSLLLIIACGARAQEAWPMGRHALAIECPGGELPFGLILDAAGGRLRGWIENGPERIEIPRVTWDDELVLDFTHYDSQVVLRVDSREKRLHGTWTKVRGAGKASRMKVVTSTSPSRFPVSAAAHDPSWIDGRWAVRFASSEDPAVGLFTAAKSPPYAVTGTFMTTLGDYRYLAGNVDRGVTRLSCFDGAHAFLFHMRSGADGTMSGDFWSSGTWHEKLSGKRDASARLPDCWKLTSWIEGADLSKVTFTDLDGKQRSLDDPAFQGKARLIEVFGTWCPNCHDHGAYMAELHRRYADKGLRVLGLAFEHTDDHARSARQVKAFRERHGARFPVLIAGLSDKDKATDRLGLLDRIRSYPTTIFMDGAGRIRGVHQGFSGPATREAHDRLRRRFESLIEDMLASK